MVVTDQFTEAPDRFAPMAVRVIAAPETGELGEIEIVEIDGVVQVGGGGGGGASSLVVNVQSGP